MIIEQIGNSIVIFSRDNNNNRIMDKIVDFQPYFYIGISENIFSDYRIKNISLSEKKTLFGEEVKKVIVSSSYDAFKLRDMFFQTYEADISYVWRYYIDRVKEIPRENLRKFYLDIETADFPSNTLDDQPITCIGIWDNYSEKHYTFILDSSISVKTIEEREKHTIFKFLTEYDLLLEFVKFIKEYNPDMIIAHNGDKFDFPVIVGRLIKLTVMGYGMMSPINIVKRDNIFGEWKTKIGGRILFDFLGSRTNYGTKGGIRGLLDGRDISIKDEDGNDKIIRMKRWSLAYLAQFVKMKKGKYEKADTVEKMIEYNKQDVDIMIALDKYFNVTEYYHNMQILIGCPYESTYFNTNMIDFFLLKRYQQYVFPTKPKRGKYENEVDIKGATVDIPKRGLYQKLYVVDQTSLYPSTIVSANLSPDKLSTDGNIHLSNGLKFDDTSIGIFPDAVKYLLDIRLKYKKLAKEEKDSYKSQMYDLLSNGYKTLLVSFYGALLYTGFRLYQKDVAESIPMLGREIKEHVRRICENSGYEIIFGDTDSSALNKKKEDAIPIEELVNIINKSFDEFSLKMGIKKHIFNIELDKTYSPIIVSDVKKRYVGYLEKGGKKIYKVTGFESVRRDTSPITEIMQENVFKMILGGKNKKDIDKYIQSLKEDIINKKYPIEYLMLPKGFSKKFENFQIKSPWIRGVEYSNKYLNTKFDHFSEIGIFYIKNVPEGKEPTDVIAINEETNNILNGFIIDWNIQFEKTIDSKVQNIFDMLGWEDTKQKTLFESYDST